MPALGVPNCRGSTSQGAAPQDGIPHTSALATPSPHPAATCRCSKKASEPSSALDAKVLQAFINVKPFSSDAAALLDGIHKGSSELFKIPRQRQISMLYKAFQHFWLESLSGLHHSAAACESLNSAAEPFHKGKKASTPRFSINPKSVASLCSGSPDYMRCRLEGYPLNTRYPESASELQQWRPWEATPSSESPAADDEVELEVAEVTGTLVFRLVSAFLMGSESGGGLHTNGIPTLPIW